jgi:hypothetical protein
VCVRVCVCVCVCVCVYYDMYVYIMYCSTRCSALNASSTYNNGAAMRNKRLAPIWEEEQGIEITGLFERGCLKNVKRSNLPAGTRVIGSRFHYKIKRHSAGKHKNRVKRLKVRVVVQGQHMSKDKGDFKDAFSPVPHLSGVRCCMSVATGMKWKAVGVDLTQGFIQAELRTASPSTSRHPC